MAKTHFLPLKSLEESGPDGPREIMMISLCMCSKAVGLTSTGNHHPPL